MKKKVLFFTNGLYGGGAEQILLTLLTHIDYTLFNITLYSLTKDDITTTSSIQLATKTIAGDE